MIKKYLDIIIDQAVVPLSLVGLVMVLLLSNANPYFYPPNRDNGLFLYLGRMVQQGGVLYKDVWDNKPPLIFLIDSLGLWLGQDTRWGVWLIEFVFLTLSAWIAYRVIKTKWQTGAAVFASILWMSGISGMMVTGNLIEGYALLFAFSAILFFALGTKSSDAGLWESFVGITAGLSFFLRPNTIGIQISIGLAWFIWGMLNRQFKITFKRLIFWGSGFLIPCLVMSGYLLYEGNIYEAFTASFLYGLYYSGGHGNLANSIISGFQYVGIPAWITLAGYLLVLIKIFNPKHIRKMEPWDIFLVIGWPLEILFSSLSGRAYEHYFISWAPAMAVTGGYLFYLVSKAIKQEKIIFNINRFANAFLLIVCLGLLIVNRQTVLEYRRPLLNKLANAQSEYEKIDRVSNYVKTFSDPDDFVLGWGGQAGINYMAKRDTPTPFFWYPLYIDSPYTGAMNSRFLQDLKSRQPELIIDCMIDAVLEIPSINDVNRQKQIDAGYPYILQYVKTANLSQTINYIHEHYDFETTVDQHDIYRLKGSSWKDKVPEAYTW